MKSFSQFSEDAQASSVAAHQARTAGMRQATSGTVGGRKASFRKRPSTGISKALFGQKKKPVKPVPKKPTPLTGSSSKATKGTSSLGRPPSN